MSHSHTHAHPHDHGHAAVSAKTMGGAVVVTLLFVAIEALSGWSSRSLALLSDAGHNLADAAALGLSWYAVWIAGRRSHHGMTVGYHRVAIFAARINPAALVVMALRIGIEAVSRFHEPEPANGYTMMVVAALAVVINIVIGVRLHRG